jgi:hypothetical protein
LVRSLAQARGKIDNAVVSQQRHEGLMPSESFHSQRFPAEWSGARALLEKWLARRCAAESLVNAIGGALFLVVGVIALALTSCITAGVLLFLIVAVNTLLFYLGFHIWLVRPTVFAVLFIFFLMLSIVHAYKTRWDSDSTAGMDFDSAFSSLRSMAWEFLSAGPILFVLSAQDFSRFVRLSRMDTPQVSALLLWLFDKGGRAGFAEISMVFPGLNAVRVLPQLRDIPGINWWPGDGEISISETLQHTFAEILGRKPRSAPFFSTFTDEHAHARKPVVEAGGEVYQWYAILGLPVFASLSQVKTRYRKLAKVYHPDARASRRVAGEIVDDEQMKRINEAYHNILKESERRAGVAP